MGRSPKGLSISLGATGIVAAVSSQRFSPKLWTKALPELWWENSNVLAEALREAKAAHDLTEGSLHVSVLPPLVQSRRLELPPLKDIELCRVLARDARRYFVGATEPQVVAVGRVGAARRSPTAYLAFAAPVRLLDCVHEAARQAGLVVSAVQPAHAVWEKIGCRMWPGLAAGRGKMVVPVDRACDVLEFEKGEVVALRRLPVSKALDCMRANADDGEPSTIVTISTSLEREAHEAGIAISTPTQPLPEVSVQELTAAYGLHAKGPLFVMDQIRSAQVAASRALGKRCLAAALILLVLSAAVELWGTRREIAAVTATRAALRVSVSQAMEAREDLDALMVRIASLREAEAGGMHWSPVLSSLAANLPKHAYLASLRAEGDSLVASGTAQKAVEVFESLQRAPGFKAVRADAPIRQEAGDGTIPVERFSLAARLTGIRDSIGGSGE